MRFALLVLAAVAVGCARKEAVVPPKQLKSPEQVTGVVKAGWSHEQVSTACGAPKETFPMGAPNVDEVWVYDVPTDSPTHRVQVFFMMGKVTTTATIPFSSSPGGPVAPGG